MALVSLANEEVPHYERKFRRVIAVNPPCANGIYRPIARVMGAAAAATATVNLWAKGSPFTFSRLRHLFLLFILFSRQSPPTEVGSLHL